MLKFLSDLFGPKDYFVNLRSGGDSGLDLIVMQKPVDEPLPPTAVTESFSTFAETSVKRDEAIIRLAKLLKE